MGQSVLSPHHIPYWKVGALTPRSYQFRDAERVMQNDCLLVYDTGVGKTLVAALTAAKLLDRMKAGEKIILLAPGLVLLTEHFKYFQKMLDLPPHTFVQLDGTIAAVKRETFYTDPEVKFLFMTPQTLQNDLGLGRSGGSALFTLATAALIIFDEAHHARGKYAYTEIAKEYRKTRLNARILGMTASPGTSGQTEGLCGIMGIHADNIIYVQRQDDDFREYSYRVEKVKVGVDMTPIMRKVREFLQQMTERANFDYIEHLETLDPEMIPRNGKMNAYLAPRHMQKLAALANASDHPEARTGLFFVAKLTKLFRMISDIEIYGLGSFVKKIEVIQKKMAKGKASKADQSLYTDYHIQDMYRTAKQLQIDTPEALIHPKLPKLVEIINIHMLEHPSARVLIFASHRTTVSELVTRLKREPQLSPKALIGQSSKSKKDKGLSKKKQVEVLDLFKKGVYNVLVATNVAEEGLDVAECNLIVCYDIPGSKIRSIQREGRTGRSMDGKIVLLYTKGVREQERVNKVAKERKIKAIPSVGKIGVSENAKTKGILKILPPEFTVVVSPVFDLALPPKIPKIGIDFLNASRINLAPANLSFLRYLQKKGKLAEKYLIVVDASGLSQSDLAALGKIIARFRASTGLAVTIAKNAAGLTLKVRNIVETYARHKWEIA